MNQGAETGLMALDVGSGRVKLGWFPARGACSSESLSSVLPIAAVGFPQPDETLAVAHRECSPGDLIEAIQQWLEQFPWQTAQCLMASVRPELNPLLQELFDHRLRQLSAADLPLEVRVDQPDKVGVDRLLSAVAANRLRQPQRAAITVDLGTATTVDLIGADGAFEGGAILPGLGLSAAALHAGTSSLPQLSPTSIDAPPAPVGKSTALAIQAGLYWGAVGAVRQLARMQTKNSDTAPQVFVTGGDAALLTEQLVVASTAARHVPHMVLVGMAITEAELS